VTIVGQVRNINPQSTNVTYRIDDGTGTIEVKKWIDADKDGDGAPQFELDQQVRVWGRLKAFNNKRHLGAHFMRAVDDFNEVSYHLLEAAYAHLYYTKGPLTANGAGAQQRAGDGGDSMFVDQPGGGNKAANCSPAAQKMFRYLQGAPGGNEGVHMQMVASGTGLGSRDVLAAADELLGQGLIYPTIDDETWALLDY
jgi:replication factor A2